MRTREFAKKDKGTRATLVLEVIEKNLEASGRIHENLKVANDLMIETAKDVLNAPSK